MSNKSILQARTVGTVVLVVLASLVTAAGGNAAPQGGSNSEVILYGTSVDSSHALYSTDEPSRDMYDSQAADDVRVPGGRTWRITRIAASGFFENPTMGPLLEHHYRKVLGEPPVDVTVYADARSLPGAEIARFEDLSPLPGQFGYIEVTLPQPLALRAGTYWISIQPNMDWFPNGGWYWYSGVKFDRSASAVWRNPGDGFATGCVSWTPKFSCFSAPGWENMSLTVYGYDEK